MRKHEQIIEHTCLRLMFLDNITVISLVIKIPIDTEYYGQHQSVNYRWLVRVYKTSIGCQGLTGITWSE